MPDGASLDELTAFVATAHASSFTVAAQRIRRDASAVSRRVSQLEGRLGVRLLTRTTRTVALTEAGAVFYRRAKAALDELDAAAREVSALSTDPQGTLKITLPVSYGREVIAPLLPAFISKYPKITLDVAFLDRAVDLVAEGFDLAIRVGAIRDSTLVSRKIDAFASVLVASPGYVERSGRPGLPGDLADHACLGFTGHLTWPEWTFARAGETASIRPTGPMISNNAEALLSAALDDVGISLAAVWLAAPHLASGRLMRLLPDWDYIIEAGVYALMPGGVTAGKTRAFLDAVIKMIGTSTF